MTAFMTEGFGSEWKGLFNMVSFPCKVSASDVDFGLREERAIAPTFQNDKQLYAEPNFDPSTATIRLGLWSGSCGIAISS